MNKIAKEKTFLDTFSIDDQDSCVKAIKYGGIAAMVSAAITGVFGVAGFSMNAPDKAINYFLDPWILVDVALLVVLGIFVFRKSRVAATILVLYFVASRLMVWSAVGEMKGWFVAVIYLFFYVNAMRGTYVWHSKYRSAPVKTDA